MPSPWPVPRTSSVAHVVEHVRLVQAPSPHPDHVHVGRDRVVQQLWTKAEMHGAYCGPEYRQRKDLKQLLGVTAYDRYQVP
jgi:hypothetical protein